MSFSLPVKLRGVTRINSIVRAIINAIVAVYELDIGHAGIKDFITITAIVDFKLDVLPVVHDFVAYESGYGPNIVVAKMNVIVFRYCLSTFWCRQYLTRNIFEFRHCGTCHSADCVLTAAKGRARQHNTKTIPINFFIVVSSAWFLLYATRTKEKATQQP